MKITKRGRYRNDGTTELADDEMKIRIVHAEKQNDDLALQVKGKDQGNNYVYSVILDDDELLKFVRHRLSRAGGGRAEKAVGEGALATLAQLLSASSN
ncbi:hypothetical protein [Pseudomonas panipatensis]|uniref:hypothetical protein n=1 Tax=Pseudomonas panipatensis TaxID=428992 RepID=UPI00111371EE|nr:hypothetical protein [Pseudomonas panipatensis]